jgi:hypothetical protein
MKSCNGKKTFIRITNEDIYKELKDFKEQNVKEHQEIITKHSDNKAEIDMVKWVAGAALGMSVFVCAGLITKIL